MLVHGALAHARWWDHLAPEILRLGFDRVIAMDLAGHGDSDALPSYSRRAWGDQLIALLDAADAGTGTAVIGHSLGGVVALEAAHRAPDRWDQTVLIDSVTHWRPQNEPGSPFGQSSGADAAQGADHRRYFPTPDDLLSRFRLIPSQPMPDPRIIEHIVRTGIRESPPLGWSWKFDPGIFTKRADDPLPGIAPTLRNRISYIRGELSSLIPESRYVEITEVLGPDRTRTVAGAYHHVILDRPAAFIDALSELLSDPADRDSATVDHAHVHSPATGGHI